VRVMDFGIGAVSAAPAADRSRTSLSIEGNVSSLVTGLTPHCMPRPSKCGETRRTRGMMSTRSE